MKPSILRNILLAFLGLGIAMGIVFPIFAELFVEFKEGLHGWFVLSCLGAGVVIGLANYYILKLVLVSKLTRIAKVSTAISQHDLTFSCVMESNDVIGDIINSFNNMAATLRGVVSELKTGSENMLSGVNNICTVADQTRQGVETQNNQTQEVEVAIERMTNITSKVSSRAEQAATAATRAKGEAEKGVVVVGHTISAIKNLASAVENASNSINKVESESINIGGVVDVIRGISEQTNLLALNAAIEAARAGDQGRGFAVVADEVRTLAQRTQESTTEIESMIETLQSVSKETVGAMKSGKSQADESVNHASKAEKSLRRISESVQRITELNTLINTEVSSQSEVSNEIGQSIHSIGQIANESLDGAEKNNSESHKLSDLAQNLQRVVAKFKL